MKVIDTTDLSEYGNDCYIFKSVSLVEVFGMYTIVVAEKVVGWYKEEKIYTSSNITFDFDKAKYMYKQHGGTFDH